MKRLLSKLRRRYDAQCVGKRRHPHYLSGLYHALSMRRLEPASNFVVYVCNFCAGVHVGHGNRELTEDMEVPNESTIDVKPKP